MRGTGFRPVTCHGRSSIAVGELDLSAFLAYYRSDGQGRPAYHPKMMTALVLYCYCKGIRSSRAVQMACFDDVGCRVITGNQAVDHATAARFVRRHRDALTGLFVQVLAVCAREGLVTVDLVAGDGTKVKASASKAASRTLEELEVSIDGAAEGAGSRGHRMVAPGGPARCPGRAGRG